MATKSAASEPVTLEPPEGVSGRFILQRLDNPGLCPACGTFTKRLWSFYPDNSLSYHPVACPACAGTTEEGEAL